MAVPPRPPPRPSPDALLRQAAREGRGRLKIFLGAAPGVGKTYEMLSDGAGRLRAGVDVVAGIVEAHGRAETQALVAPFEVVPLARIAHAGHTLAELDLDALLARRPALALVDEFAHANAPGSRHPKRWQDVVELLDAGIDVYTTLNIQHVESLNDVVASVTRVRVRETVPDHLLDDAEIELVDIPPDELIERLKDGKVYVPAEASRALAHFFSTANLSALREMALRKAAEKVDRQMLEHLDARALAGSYPAAERILVAVGEQAGADTLVRTAKRLADALRAPWQAIFIETPRAAAFGDAERAAIGDALRLAASLGATIVTVPAASVVEGLRAQVQGMRATQLVIGRSRRTWWFALRHRSIVEAMVKAGEGLAIHVIPAGPPPARAPARSRPRPAAPAWGAHLVALALVAATTLVAEAVQPLVGVGGTDLVYLAPVILAAGRFGLWPGLVAGLAAALAYNFFFLPPVYTFTIADPQSVLTLAVFVAIAAATSELAGRLRSRALLGTRSAAENAAVAAFGQALARAHDWEATAGVVCGEIARLLDVRTILLREAGGLLREADGALAELGASAPGASLGPVDRAAAEWCASRGEPAGNGTATLNAADWLFHPLATSLGVLAVLGVARDDGREPVPPERQLLLATLLGQAALAHERLRLEDELREVGTLRERDRLRGALLSSIGHDLRTPLTAVQGAIEAIGHQFPDAAAVPVAKAELHRLRRSLDDLTGMLRLDTDALAPRREPIDLMDAVSLAVHDVRDLLRANRVTVDIPPDLALVTADARLLHHMLINLLINAARHGRPAGAIAIAGARDPDHVLLTIADDGPGLPATAPAALFETFARGAGSDRDGGSGVGLAIVKGFADAMRIGVTAGNAPEGGARFVLRFAPARPGAGDAATDDPATSWRGV